MRSPLSDRNRTDVLLAKLILLLRQIPFLGTALRWYVGKYPEGSVVAIRSGYARGMKWRRHHRYINGYWLGQYELKIQAALARELKTGAVFFDVGANAGFFTLIAASKVGPSGKCVAFDPDDENIASISEQCHLNGLSSVVGVNEAVSDLVGYAWFARPHSGALTGHLCDHRLNDESIKVPTTTLDAAAAKYGVPDLVKIDIEGGEGKALRGAVWLLKERRPTWLIEIHGPASEADVRSAFQRAGYGLCSLTGEPLAQHVTLPKFVLIRPDMTRPEPDGR